MPKCNTNKKKERILKEIWNVWEVFSCLQRIFVFFLFSFCIIIWIVVEMVSKHIKYPTIFNLNHSSFFQRFFFWWNWRELRTQNTKHGDTLCRNDENKKRNVSHSQKQFRWFNHKFCGECSVVYFSQWWHILYVPLSNDKMSHYIIHKWKSIKWNRQR